MEMFTTKLLLFFLSLTGISIVTGYSTCTRLLDVIAVVDGSDSLTPEDFSSLKTLLVQFAKSLELGDGSQRFGAVVYSSGVTDTAPLSSDFDGLKTQISAFVHPADGSHTHTGIKKMKEMFEKNRREGVPMVAIVITDGRSKNPSATLAAAKEAKDFGVKIIAVGVGSKVNQGELSGIATSQADVKHIINFNHLQALVPTLVKEFCIEPWVEPEVTTHKWAVCNGRMRYVSGNYNEYQENVFGVGWVTRQCPRGTVYNTTGCSCVHGRPAIVAPDCRAELYLPFNGDYKDHSRNKLHVQNVNGVKISAKLQLAYFGNTTFLRVNRFSNAHFGNSLLIDFLMNKGATTGRNHAIVTNADCGEAGSIYIIMRKDIRVEFRVIDAAGQTNTLMINYTVPRYSLTRVRLLINGGMMMAEVNNKSDSTPFKGNIAKSHWALQIGKGTGFDGYRGVLDDFKLYLCNP